MKRKLFITVIAALLLLSLPGVAMASSFTIATEPAALEGAGVVTLQITIVNDGIANMESIYIGGPGVSYSADGRTIKPGESLYFPLSGLALTAEQIGVPLTYTVTWKENGVPMTADLHVTVAQGSAVALEASRTADKSKAVTGDIIKLTYTLKNTGSVALNSVSIADKNILRGKNIAEDMTIQAGETKTVEFEYKMGDATVISRPVVTYRTAAQPSSSDPKTYSISELSLGLINSKLEVSVEAGAASPEGTPFTIHLANNGNQTVKKIYVSDDQGNKINDDAIALTVGEERTLEYLAVTDKPREVYFTITGQDGAGLEYSDKTEVFNISAYVDPSLIELSFSAAVVSSLDSSGSTTLRFSINNGGGTMTNAVLSESELGDLETLGDIAVGEQVIEKQLNVGSPRQMVFTLAATDVGGNKHNYVIKLNAAYPVTQNVDDPPDALFSSQGTPAVGTPAGDIPAPEQAGENEQGGLRKTLTTLAIVLGILIALAVAALFVIKAAEQRNAAHPRRMRMDEDASPMPRQSAGRSNAERASAQRRTPSEPYAAHSKPRVQHQSAQSAPTRQRTAQPPVAQTTQPRRMQPQAAPQRKAQQPTEYPVRRQYDRSTMAEPSNVSPVRRSETRYSATGRAPASNEAYRNTQSAQNGADGQEYINQDLIREQYERRQAQRERVDRLQYEQETDPYRGDAYPQSQRPAAPNSAPYGGTPYGGTPYGGTPHGEAPAGAPPQRAQFTPMTITPPQQRSDDDAPEPVLGSRNGTVPQGSRVYPPPRTSQQRNQVRRVKPKDE